MKYSKKEIGQELMEELKKKYSVERISSWAYDLLYIKVEDRQIDPEISSILHSISVMDAGPEFAYSEQELILLASLLINEEEDPIKKINERIFKPDF